MNLLHVPGKLQPKIAANEQLRQQKFVQPLQDTFAIVASICNLHCVENRRKGWCADNGGIMVRSCCQSLWFGCVEFQTNSFAGFHQCIKHDTVSMIPHFLSRLPEQKCRWRWSDPVPRSNTRPPPRSWTCRPTATASVVISAISPTCLHMIGGTRAGPSSIPA